MMQNFNSANRVEEDVLLVTCDSLVDFLKSPFSWGSGKGENFVRVQLTNFTMSFHIIDLHYGIRKQ